MAKIAIRKIDSTIEKRIITGMIVSDRYLREVYDLINLDYFRNEYAKTIAEWCLGFYDNYEIAPFHEIQNIYTEYKEALKVKPEEAEIIETLLKETSKKYSKQKINADVLLDQTVLYFKKRELEITVSNIKILLDENKINEAEDEVLSFHKLSRVASQWVNPFDEKSIKKVFQERVPLVTLPGQLGRYTGAFERRWLVGLAGGFKRGKTWVMQKIALSAMLDFLKVAVISLEMQDFQLHERIYKELISAVDPDNTQVIFPVFDCTWNQYGTCNRSERINDIQLTDSEDTPVPKYNPNDQLHTGYVPCTACMHVNPEDYRMTTWFEVHERPPFDEFEVQKQMKAYKRLYNNNLRTLSYGRFEANVSDIKRDLEILRVKDDFIPDVILIDYVDILRPERESLTGVAKEDESWMALAMLAAKEHCLIVTPTQITKDGLDSNSISSQHMARWVGKLGHVDQMLTVNQKPEEKVRGFSRLGMIAHRHRDFDIFTQCYMLQNLSAGQVHLNSAILRSE